MIKDDVHMEMQNDGNRQVRIVLLGRSLFQAFCSLQNYELAFDLVSVLPSPVNIKIPIFYLLMATSPRDWSHSKEQVKFY